MTQPDLAARIDAIVEREAVGLVALRRHLHAHPELSWHEEETQAHLESWLAERGIRTRRSTGTGLVADIGPDGPRSVYRGDIDALPIDDAKARRGVPWASRRPGVCHACGHDVHATIAAGVAVVLHELADWSLRPCRIVFQPAEEVAPAGGEAMVRDGVLDNCERGFAVHVDPTRDMGTVGVRVGVLTASTDTFVVDVVGRSGHSARPWLARDAIVAAADVVQALYRLVGQVVDPRQTAVLNVGTIHGGDARNVIAGRVRLEGVVRTLDAGVRADLHREIRTVVTATAMSAGCDANTELIAGAPSVINDPGLAEIVRNAAASVLGEQAVATIHEPSTGAEDFGFFGEVVPVFMLRLGTRAPGAEVTHLHTPEFDVDERAIATAVRIMSRAMLTG